MKKRLQKPFVTSCYLQVSDFYIINGVRNRICGSLFFSCHYKIVLTGVRNDPLPDSAATFEIQDAFRCNVAIFLLSPALLYIFSYPFILMSVMGRCIFQSTEHPAFGCLTILILFGIVRNLLAFSFLQPV